ncbi:PAS domain-containing sensor histidine kinase [Halorubrum sp. Eb13]|uniref:sensor histidine kinase n=1 Tax=Halorubrum sp. Eb13 TaxID=1383843 RepID=UPI000B99C98A|nr:PAS domain-containing sensor histidine kinase [Halorubrum sp. Eb13]OYR42051.1 histidine kinase [Halorubrum sp. Eb13]
MSSKKRFELPSEYDTLHIGVAVYDPETGTILDTNERLEQILGYNVEKLRHLSVAEYTANTYPHSESEFHDRLRESANGQSQQFTWRVKREDGELIWVQLFMTQQRSGRENCVHVKIRDITDYYETHHRAELFWRILRHNLRNEAAIILGYTNQLTEHAEIKDVKDIIETIRLRGENLGNMAESVKEIEQAVTDSYTECTRRPAIVGVRAITTQISTDYPAAEISTNERERMWIDINDAFGYALTHAVENAIIHSNDDTPVVEINVGPSPNTGRVEICIKDTNSTISDEELEVLFAPTETTNTSHGSGIGLFVMKWCIESLGGEVSFRTRASGGNAVSLYLPPKATPDTTEEYDTSPRTT